MRITGTGNYVAMGIVNVLFLDAAFIALIQLSKLIFSNKKILNITMFLLLGCLQQILLCTFIYGNIMGLALAMWAVVLEIMYIKSGKKYVMLVSTVLIALAIIAKLNYSICLVAMCIILLLNFLKTVQWFNLISILIALVLTLSSYNLIISSYEARASIKLGSGVPQILWTAMGFQESQRAPGWYNSYTINTFKESNYDSNLASQEVESYIVERIAYLASNPKNAADFFGNKVLSQWNEPSYECIWVSQVKKHVSSVPSFVESVYTGQLGQYLGIYFNFYQQMILIGFIIALLASLKKPNLLFTFIPLIILGGFLYHLINEAKSQYILVYFVIMVPYAA